MAELTRNEGRFRLGGLTLTGIAAIAAIVLSLIGLWGVEPVVLMSIASVFLGIALLMGAGTTGARYSETFAGVDIETEESAGSGLAFNSLAGLAGIVLGILSLIGVSPGVLLPSAAITFGCAMLLESASAGSSRETMYAASGIHLISGVAAVVLGILALSGYNPAVLTFVAFLIVGCASLLTGTSLVQRASTAINRRF